MGKFKKTGQRQNEVVQRAAEWISSCTKSKQPIMDDDFLPFGEILASPSKSTIDNMLTVVSRLLPDVLVSNIGLVSRTCGALVESGGNPNILGSGLIRWIPKAYTKKTSQQNLEWFELGVVAHVTRSKSLLSKVRGNSELLGVVLDRGHWLTMLIHLIDESIIIIHPEQHKGFEVHVSGLPFNDNFFSYIGRRLVGRPDEGWLTTNKPKGMQAFNHWNYESLLPNGFLPDVQINPFAGEKNWLWPNKELWEIPVFEQKRIVLLGPVPYEHLISSEKTFLALPQVFKVEKKLSDDEVTDWLTRLLAAPHRNSES
jgi:hypothetical protein